MAVDQEKVAAMFEATCDLGDWTGAALAPQVRSLGKTGDSMRFTVTPGGALGDRALPATRDGDASSPHRRLLRVQDLGLLDLGHQT